MRRSYKKITGFLISAVRLHGCAIAFAAAILLLDCASAYGQFYRDWVRRFNGTGNSFDIASGILPVPGGGVIAYGTQIGTGTLTDFALIKYGNTGNVIWTASYDGPAGLSDQLYSAVLDSASNIVTTGFVTETDQSPRLAVLKFNSAGRLVWKRIISDAGYVSGSGQTVSVTSGNGIIVAGYQNNPNSQSKVTIASLDSAGRILHSRLHEQPGSSIPVDVIADAGGLVLAYEKGTEPQGSDIAVAGFDLSLNQLWERTFSGSTQNSFERPTDLKRDKSGSTYLCGSISNTGSSQDYLYVKLGPAGNILWQGTYNGTGNNIDYPASLAVDDSGNVYVTGHSRNGPSIGDEDILTIKLSAGGSLLWQARFNGSEDGIDGANAIEVDTDGNVFVGGYSDRGGAYVTYAFLWYGSDGSLMWFDRYSIANKPEDFIYSLAIGNAGDVYATGISVDPASDYDIATIRYVHISSVSNGINPVPGRVKLIQNFPNPFNPSTVVNYELSETAEIGIMVSDAAGRIVEVIDEGTKGPGSRSIVLNTENWQSGVYFCAILLNGEIAASMKMVKLE